MQLYLPLSRQRRWHLRQRPFARAKARDQLHFAKLRALRVAFCRIPRRTGLTTQPAGRARRVFSPLIRSPTLPIGDPAVGTKFTLRSIVRQAQRFAAGQKKRASGERFVMRRIEAFGSGADRLRVFELS